MSRKWVEIGHTTDRSISLRKNSTPTQPSIENKIFQNLDILTFAMQNTVSKKQSKEDKHRDLCRQNFINLQ